MTRLDGLWGLGRYARARFKGQLVAITGSVGKTTTKEMLRTVLATAGKTHAAPRLLQQPMGRAASPWRGCPPTRDFCVAELGTQPPRRNHARSPAWCAPMSP